MSGADVYLLNREPLVAYECIPRVECRDDPANGADEDTTPDVTHGELLHPLGCRLLHRDVHHVARQLDLIRRRHLAGVGEDDRHPHVGGVLDECNRVAVNLGRR